jgi:hypothetical protein
VARRWDDDSRGHGIADAAQLVPGATELLASFEEPAWVAEHPELHLRPHIEAWCEHDPRVALIDARADDREAYVVELEWLGERGGVGQARAAVFELIGQFAESATYVRQRRVSRNGDAVAAVLQFELGTGEVGADIAFAPHGHTVLINVLGVI